MPIFNKNFEITRLAMLASQYPAIVEVRGDVTFKAEDDEDFLNGSSWILEEEMINQVSESGFKTHLLELLDNLIEYRGKHNEHPRKGGVVRFGDGLIKIDWQP